MTAKRIKYLNLLLIAIIVINFISCSDKPGSVEKIRDIDGNTYNTVKIGDQVWMAENLKTTSFSDGSPIPSVENYESWAELRLPAYCWYNNDSLYSETHGALYNYHVVETEKLCPEGWHVPSDEDWIALETKYGGAGMAGGSLKEIGTEFWKTPNTEASNESNFTALPGGYRSYNGTFNLIRIEGFWWSSTEKSWYGSKSTVIYRNLSYDDQGLVRNIAEKNNGFSVRCVKNP